VPSSDPYDVLGVDPGSDAATIRAAYLALIREHHPDHRPGDPGELARRVNAAYRIVGDETRRAAHDRRHAPRTPRPAPAPAEPAPVNVVRPPAYSEERRSFQRSFTRATVRYALVLFVVGTVLLLSLAAQ
jgi:curved DNA-binding protein CbpA